jgi:hypothetical protein
LVNIKTGEIISAEFIPYKKFRFHWQDVVLRHLVRKKIISPAEAIQFRRQYQNGFHVYFQSITGTENDVLFRTAEYLASGYFHNSQILKVDNEKRRITFCFRSWIDRKTRKRSHTNMTLDIFEFMARMLYFLPDHHRKSIRYYGLYASTYRKAKVESDSRDCSWSAGIENSFEKKPEFCPDCSCEMTFSIIYSFQARKLYRFIRQNFVLKKGYFRQVRGP